MRRRILAILVASVSLGVLRAAEDILIADFEGTNYESWNVTGEAFGPGPARGTLPGQMVVEGYLGHGLVSSFYHGDGTTGALTSPGFKLERRFLKFLIGGGGYPGKTCINLLVNAQIVRTATSGCSSAWTYTRRSAWTAGRVWIRWISRSTIVSGSRNDLPKSAN